MLQCVGTQSIKRVLTLAKSPLKPSSDTLKATRSSAPARPGVVLEFIVALPYMLVALGLLVQTLFPLYPIGLALLLPSGFVAVCALVAPGPKSGRHPLLATLALANVVLGTICWIVLSYSLDGLWR